MEQTGLMDIDGLLAFGRKNDCSDLHLTAGLPPVFRKDGILGFSKVGECADCQALIRPMLTKKQQDIINSGEDLDFAYKSADGMRQRVNIYHQRGSLCAALRLLREDIPTLRDLSMPEVVTKFCGERRGLVLVTGPTGSGKSTTLAAMLDEINRNRRCHILTIEDPVEYVHEHKRSMINQREVGCDVNTFAGGLRSALREDPDVILVGEMRDFETISAAITAAETGHLVLSTLHTTGAARTIDRIIDVFPPYQQQQIRTQLAGTLKGIVSQQLVPKVMGGRIAALEVLVMNDALANMIRSDKGHQITSEMQIGQKLGMRLMDHELARLVNEDVISVQSAIEMCVDRSELDRHMTGGYR